MYNRIYRILDWMRDEKDSVLAFIFLLFVTAVLAVVIVGAIKDNNAWMEWCEGQGGAIKSHTETGTGVSGNGDVVVTSSTTRFCLSEDGRVLDIR